jgi:hypothetical protein
MLNFESLAVRGDGGDAEGDANTNIAENQFIQNGVGLLRTQPLRIENGFGIIEGYVRLLRG